MADMMSNVRTLDHAVDLLEVGSSGMETSEVVEHEALQLVFSARRVQVYKRAYAGGIL